MKSGDNLTSEQIDSEGIYAVYGGNGLRGYFSRFNNSGEYILVGRQGALCGNVHYVEGNFWATDHAIVTSPIKDNYIKYLYYLLCGMNLNQYSQTAAQPGLSVNVIKNLETCIPPLNEQIAIAEFLDEKCSKIDQTIEQKEVLIKQLEEYKQSLIYECVTGKRCVL